MKSFVEPDANT